MPTQKKFSELNVLPSGILQPTMIFAVESDPAGTGGWKCSVPQLYTNILGGFSGGKTLVGGTAPSEKLTLTSTSNATKGSVEIGTGDNFAFASDGNLVSSITIDPNLASASDTQLASSLAIKTYVDNHSHPIPNHNDTLNIQGGIVTERYHFTASKYAQFTTNTLSASSVVVTDTVGAGSVLKTVAVLPISLGGTNSSTALANNKVMISATNAIVESSAVPNGITATTQIDGDNSTKIATTEYVDRKIIPVGSQERIETLPILTNGQTAFTLTKGTPLSSETFHLYLNGQRCSSFTRVGVNITWTGKTLLTTDELVATFNKLDSGTVVTSVFTRIGDVIASAGDYSASQITNDSGVTGAYVKDALNTLNGGKEPTLTKGNLTEATSSVLTISGGTNAVIGSGTTVEVKQAGSTQNGYLTSTDWSTFNAKEPALTKGNLTTSTSGVSIGSGTSAVIGSGTTVNVSSATTSAQGLVQLVTSVPYSTGTSETLAATQKGVYDVKFRAKRYSICADHDNTWNYYRVKKQTASATFYYNFTVPLDFTALTAAYIEFYVEAGAAGTARNIDLAVQYNTSAGDLYNRYTASDSTTTYDFTGYTNARYLLPFTALLTNLTAGSIGGLSFTTVAIGGELDVTRVIIDYV